MKTSLPALASVLAIIFSLGVSQAAPKKPAASEDAKPAADAKAEKPATTRNTYPLYGVVVAVSPRVLTIKGGVDKPDRKYTINTETTFNNAGKAATIDDVVVGKKVGGLIEKSETGNDKIIKINVGVSQEATPKKPKADASKKSAKDTKGDGKGEAEPTKPAAKKKSA